MKKIIFLFLITLAVLFDTSLSAQTAESYQLSTHILDINLGKPAKGVSIVLYKLDEASQEFKQVDSGKTNENGRIANFLSLKSNNRGIYKLKFETYPYFSGRNIESIYPYIEVVFEINDQGHYHIPITVSANGYSTYRGN